MTCRLPHHDLTGTSNRWVSHGLADVAAARSSAPPPDWRRSGRPVDATRIVDPCLVNRCLTAQQNDAVDGLPTGGRGYVCGDAGVRIVECTAITLDGLLPLDGRARGLGRRP